MDRQSLVLPVPLEIVTVMWSAWMIPPNRRKCKHWSNLVHFGFCPCVFHVQKEHLCWSWVLIVQIVYLEKIFHEIFHNMFVLTVSSTPVEKPSTDPPKSEDFEYVVQEVKKNNIYIMKSDHIMYVPITYLHSCKFTKTFQLSSVRKIIIYPEM